MSYILDALRKSEQERQRGTSPGLDTIHVPTHRGPERKLVWPWLLALVLSLNAAGILVWWLGPWRAKQEQAAAPSVSLAAAPSGTEKQDSVVTGNGLKESTATPSPLKTKHPQPAGGSDKAAAQTPESAQPQEPLPPVTVQSRRSPDRIVAPAPKQPSAPPANLPGKLGQAKPAEPSRPDGSLAAGGAGNPTVPPAKSVEPTKSDDPKRGATKAAPPAPAGAQVAARAPAVPSQGGAAEMGLIEDLKPLISETRPARKEPEFRQMPASVRNDIPKLSLSFLVYSDKPAERRVTINGKVLREGDEVAEGLKLETITHEGAVFNYKGHQFHKGVF